MTNYQPIRTEADVLAVQACIAGKASEDQQKRAMAWIMTEACMIQRESYSRGDPYETAHAEGRRYAGIQIRVMTEPLTLQAARQHDSKTTQRTRGTPK